MYIKDDDRWVVCIVVFFVWEHVYIKDDDRWVVCIVVFFVGVGTRVY